MTEQDLKKALDSISKQGIDDATADLAEITDHLARSGLSANHQGMVMYLSTRIFESAMLSLAINTNNDSAAVQEKCLETMRFVVDLWLGKVIERKIFMQAEGMAGPVQ